MVVVLGFLCGATAIVDMDFHWHLRLGQLVVANGFLTAEPFSHLPVGPPDRQSWLADAMFAVLDRIGGLTLIRVVLGAVFAAGCVSVLRLARKRTSSLALGLLPVAVYFALSTARLRVRPDLFTLALLPLFLELLERRPTWRRTLDLLLVSALWANLHPGSLIAGLLALTQLWPLSRLRVANALATFAGLCLTPDGIDGLLRFTAETTPLRPLIPEWQRLWERPEFLPESVLCLYLVGVCVWAAVVRIRSGPPATTAADPDARGLEIRDLAIALLGFGLAASAVRFLFTLVLPALAATRPLDRVVARFFPVRAGVFAAAMIAIIALPLQHLDTVWTGVKAIGLSAYLGPEPPGYPVAAAQFLANSELSGNLAHPARWGGYLAWKLAPRFKTATDGRVTHFGAELASEWSQGIDSAAREEIFARRGVDLVVIPTEMLPSFRNDQPYEVLYRDPQQLAVVLLRTEGGAHSAENVRLLKDAEKQKAIQRALGK